MGRQSVPLLERMQAQSAYGMGECLEWLGTTNKGYGMVGVKLIDGTWKPRRVHRMAWEMMRGPIPDGLDVCHECDNRKCWNIDHLFVGTRQENVDDMLAKGRNASIRGSNSVLSKLIEGDAERIMDMRVLMVPLIDVADAFSVSISTVSQIANRKTWRHV